MQWVIERIPVLKSSRKENTKCYTECASHLSIKRRVQNSTPPKCTRIAHKSLPFEKGCCGTRSHGLCAIYCQSEHILSNKGCKHSSITAM